jgi:glycosyltransferase involved in cell wall biosynthesis
MVRAKQRLWKKIKRCSWYLVRLVMNNGVNMKILGITPHNKETKETPEQLYLRKLSTLGHEVTIIGNAEELETSPEAFDVVASLSESTVELGYRIHHLYNIPFYAHMEWIPRWRVFKECELDWGFRGKIPYAQKMDFIKMYLFYCHFWAAANCKSVAGNCFYKDIVDFFGNVANIHTKYLGADTASLKKEKPHIGRKHDEITCVARFVPHKRLHHVLLAAKHINFSGTINMVGYGEEKKYLQELANDLQLNIKFYSSKDKTSCLKRSKCSVALWSGIVPAESLYLGTPVISYRSDYMEELYKDGILYAENNNIEDLGNKILMLLTNTQEENNKIVEEGIKKIEDGVLNVFTIDKSVKILENLLFIAIKNYKEENK